MKQEIKNKFYTKIMEDLPTLPSVIIELLEVILDEKSSVRDVSKIVQQDQTLTSKVLKIVNSAAYQFRGQIKTVDHATTILGFESLKNLLLSVSVFDRILGDDYGFNKSHFWCHSLSVAIVSQNIAKIIGYNNPDEAYVAGFELCNAFSELNDPLDQEQRFIEMGQDYSADDEERHPLDEDYLRAMRYGMPPNGGFGMGVDRLTMLLTDKHSIRDVLLFPALRKEGGSRTLKNAIY